MRQTNIFLTFLNPFPFTITQKCAKSAGIQMIQYGYEEAIVELEGIGKLLGDLPHAVHELQKHR